MVSITTGMPAGGAPLVAIILASVLLRVGSAVYQGDSIGALPGVADELSYHTLALRVLEGHGFSFGTGWWPVTRPNEPTAHWSFLYVLFVASVYGLVGAAPLAARLLQALVVGLVHPWLAWRIGRRVFGPRVGRASAAVSAVYGYFVFYGGALVTESLYFVAALWVLDRATAIGFAPPAHRRAAGLKPWAVLGLAFGVAVLLRQTFLLVIPVIVAWLAWETWRTRDASEAPGPRLRTVAAGTVVALLVLAACVLPWTVRNYRAFGQFVLLNTNAGYVFFYGAHPVHGTRFVPLQADGSAAYFALLPPQYKRARLNEAALERALLLEGFRYVKDDPWRYGLVSVSRAPEFVKFWPSADSGRASNVLRVISFGLLAPFLLAGIVVVLRQPDAADRRARSGTVLLLGVSAVYALVHLLTWTLVRYRLPIDAITAPIAAVALVKVFSSLHEPARLTADVPERSAS